VVSETRAAAVPETLVPGMLAKRWCQRGKPTDVRDTGKRCQRRSQAVVPDVNRHRCQRRWPSSGVRDTGKRCQRCWQQRWCRRHGQAAVPEMLAAMVSRSKLTGVRDEAKRWCQRCWQAVPETLVAMVPETKPSAGVETLAPVVSEMLAKRRCRDKAKRCQRCKPAGARGTGKRWCQT
jgi:hypothetical protein